MQGRNCEEAGRRGPVFICQLPDSVQEEIRGILERILLYYCGDRVKAETYFGMGLEEAVQNGMDSKVPDLSCVTEPLLRGGELDEDIPAEVREDAQRLWAVLGEAGRMETESSMEEGMER